MIEAASGVPNVHSASLSLREPTPPTPRDPDVGRGAPLDRRSDSLCQKRVLTSSG